MSHRLRSTLTIAIISAAAAGLALGAMPLAQEPAQPYVHIPTTVSEEWQERLRRTVDPATVPAFPAADDREAWRQLNDSFSGDVDAFYAAMLETFGATGSEREIGGVPVLELRPDGWQDDGRILVYLHGGAYVLGSAKAGTVSALVVAEATGTRVIAVDYTLAPQAKWPQVTDEVVAVLTGLQEEGFPLADIGLYGESAGGGLAAGAVLKMRDSGAGMPGAVVLWSPWADITETGDTYVTLRNAEPSYTYALHLKPSADAYADPADQLHPYVSPVYGDFAGGFPPTLIQGGTKEIFLSNFIRLYQALDQAGQTVKLDLYEGMPHVFQGSAPRLPEGRIAIRKTADFFAQHLGG